MKTIAIFVPSIKSGGAEKQACLLAKLLANDYNVLFIPFAGLCDAEPKNLQLLSSSSVHIIELSGSALSRIKQLYLIFRKEKVEYLFNYLTFCDVLGCIVGKLANVPYVYNGIRNSRLAFFKNLAECLTHNYLANKTIFNCYSGAEYFAKRRFRKSKMIVIPNCFEKISEQVVRADNPVKHIITVGRFVAQKDYKTALAAIEILAHHRQDFIYTIVGYGELELDIRKWVKELGIERYVQIIIRPNNIPELLSESDIYLSTSLFEGTSNSIMEAMNASLPIIATNVGDNSYMVVPERNGFLVNVRDFTAIAACLDCLLDDRQKRTHYGGESLRLLTSRYSPAIFIYNYRQLIQ